MEKCITCKNTMENYDFPDIYDECVNCITSEDERILKNQLKKLFEERAEINKRIESVEYQIEQLPE